MTRIELLLLEVAEETARGDLGAALRIADTARRLAPSNLNAALIQARLSIRLGRPQEALELLRHNTLPSAIAARAAAFCQLRRLGEAIALCQGLLGEFAIDCVDGLADTLDLVCAADPKRFPGWVGVDSSLSAVGAAYAGTVLLQSIGLPDRLIEVRSSADSRLERFRQKLEPGDDRGVSVSDGGVHLLGSPLKWPADFGCLGWVAVQDKSLIGEVRLPWSQGHDVLIVLDFADGASQQIEARPEKGASPDAVFSIPLFSLPTGPIEVSAWLPDGRLRPLIGSPLTRTKPKRGKAISARPVRRQLYDAADDPASRPHIDIVIPVFNGREHALRCIEKVLQTVDLKRADVIVVNDASSDLALCEALDHLASQGRVTLLVNETNLGFPRSANRGMSLHQDRDVVLLNSDCEVFDGWLGRLGNAAYANPDIGSATPLGDEASIASYPRNSRAEPPSAEAAEHIDGIARRVNAGRVVEVPVGVGFCMFVRRDCLAEVGDFDDVVFGKGYGEENDFCLRARRYGWRHVVAADLFVHHIGGSTFGAAKAPLMARNGHVLNALHPGYDAFIAKFVAADPLLAARRAIDLQRLLESARKPVLLVTHSLPGGVKRLVDEHAASFTARGHAALILMPEADTPSSVRLRLHGHELQDLVFALPADLELLKSTLASLKLIGTELHHFLDLPTSALKLVVELGVPYRAFLHDYSWLCPRLTMLGGDGRYCGEPTIDQCEACVRDHGSSFPASMTVTKLRARSTVILQRAERVYSATDDLRTRFRHYFPQASIRVVPMEPTPVRVAHAPGRAANGRVRVAVIGALSVQKGYQVVLDCARAAAAQDLNLEFVVIGFSSDDAPLLETGRIFITGPYRDKEAASLLEREHCHVALFASVTPETWCFTLTHALRAGMPIVAFDHGAVAERLREIGGTLLLSLGTSAKELNEQLIRMATPASDPLPNREEVSTLPPAAIAAAQQTRSDATVFHSSTEIAHLQLGGPLPSVQMLSLPAGVYSFSVQNRTSSEGIPVPIAISDDEMAMPALHVGLAPVSQRALVDFFSGPGTLDRWLVQSGDRVTARVAGESAGLLLTSLRREHDPALAIDVTRLDVLPAPEQSSAQLMHITAHVRELGDLHVTDGEMRPFGPGLWIEALIVRATDAKGTEIVEYRGVTADGFETPWLADGVLCGSRGRATPLLGFAVRLRVAQALLYDCSYVGFFGSGQRTEPLTDGSMCRSTVEGDPLEGIELRITPRP